MNTATQDPTTIWVCVDCMMTEASGQEQEDTDREVWSLLEGVEVTPGLMANEHLEDCPNIVDGQWIGSHDCPGCDVEDFSGHPCEGCGSQLAGERHAYTAWFDREDGAVPLELAFLALALVPVGLLAVFLASLAGMIAGLS